MPKIKRIKRRRPWGLTGAKVVTTYYHNRSLSSYELAHLLDMNPASIRTTLRRYGIHTHGKGGRPCHS